MEVRGRELSENNCLERMFRQCQLRPRKHRAERRGLEATLDHYELLIAAVTPFVLWRAYLTPAIGKLVLPQLQMLKLPCCHQALKPRSQPG